MKVKELREVLKHFKSNDDIIVFYETKNGKNEIVVGLEDVISACKNGNSLQLNCESTFESLYGNK